MSSYKIQEKYQKYKLKYLNIKQNGGQPSNVLSVQKLTPDILMAIIILFNKLLYTYTLYRFRYDNTKNLIDITDLSDKIFIITHNKSIKDLYKQKYIKDLISLSDEDICELKQEPTEPFAPNKLIFTLRKDTSTLIRDLYLINNESIKTINDYIEFLNKYELNKDQYSEIYEKCLQIKGLVFPGTTEFKLNKMETDLDIIRNDSSKIINIIGDDYNNTMNNIGKRANNLNEEKNDLVNDLFKSCFEALSKKLESNCEL